MLPSFFFFSNQLSSHFSSDKSLHKAESHCFTSRCLCPESLSIRLFCQSDKLFPKIWMVSLSCSSCSCPLSVLDDKMEPVELACQPDNLLSFYKQQGIVSTGWAYSEVSAPRKEQRDVSFCLLFKKEKKKEKSSWLWAVNPSGAFLKATFLQ